jgi:hypothetical protein
MISVVAAMIALGVVAYLFYRLMRWARGRTRGAYVLGALLTDVTQSPVVLEAKQGRKRTGRQAGDPPNEDETAEQSSGERR